MCEKWHRLIYISSYTAPVVPRVVLEQMPQQNHYKTQTGGRAYPPETRVLEEGLRRTFKVDDTSPFHDLLLAIDVADQERRLHLRSERKC